MPLQTAAQLRHTASHRVAPTSDSGRADRHGYLVLSLGGFAVRGRPNEASHALVLGCNKTKSYINLNIPSILTGLGSGEVERLYKDTTHACTGQKCSGITHL